jgi:hypothetical protein
LNNHLKYPRKRRIAMKPSIIFFLMGLIFLFLGWGNLSMAASNDLRPGKAITVDKGAVKKEKSSDIKKTLPQKLPLQQKKAPAGPGIKDPIKTVPTLAPTRKPFLQIQRVYLKGNTIHVVIRNTGNGSVGASDYTTAKLHVRRQNALAPWSWPLIKVDPKRTSFNNDVDFDTEKTVSEQTSLTAWLENIPTGDEWKGVLFPSAPSLKGLLKKPPKTEPVKLTKRPADKKIRPRDLRPAPAGTSESFSPSGRLKHIDPDRAAEMGIRAPESAFPAGSQGTFRREIGSLEISWFKKCVPPGTVALQFGAESSEESSDEPVEITIDRGESLDLCWRIAGSGVSNVSAHLSWTGDVDPGERRETESGGFYMRGSHTVRPRPGATYYTLRVTGETALFPLTREKEVIVRIRTFKLDVAEPGFDQETGQVTFYATNSGELPIEPAPIRVHGSISPMGETEIIPIEFTSEPIGIEPGGTVPVGSVTLPENVFRSPGISMQVTMSCPGSISLISEFTHYWETQTRRIAASILEAILGDIDIRLNNYDSSVRTGDRFVGFAYMPNDCHLYMLDYSNNFTISPFSRVYTLRDRIFAVEGFVRNLDLGSNRVEATCSPGQIAVRIPFETSDDSREIKVFVFAADRVPWERVDSWGPDANLTNLVINVVLRPVLADQTITYSDEIEVHVDIGSEFAGGWSFLDTIAPDIGRDLRNQIKDMVEDEINSRLGSSSIRRMIESQIGAFLGDEVHYIIGIETAADGLHIRYR